MEALIPVTREKFNTHNRKMRKSSPVTLIKGDMLLVFEEDGLTKFATPQMKLEDDRFEWRAIDGITMQKGVVSVGLGEDCLIEIPSTETIFFTEPIMVAGQIPSQSLITNPEFESYLEETLSEIAAGLNMKAQVIQTGLGKYDDDIRQRVCNILTALNKDGQIICGNVQRTGEAEEFAKKFKQQ